MAAIHDCSSHDREAEALNAELLNIFYVPIQESRYLYRVPFQPHCPQNAGLAIPDIGRGHGRGCHGVPLPHEYEYDYKAMLRDAVKPGNEAWWDAFEESVLGDHDDIGILGTILEHFHAPNVTKEQSLELLTFFSSESRKASFQAGAVACDDHGGTRPSHRAATMTCQQQDLHPSLAARPTTTHSDKSTQTMTQFPRQEKGCTATFNDPALSADTSDSVLLYNSPGAVDIIKGLMDSVSAEKGFLLSFRNAYRNQSFDSILYQHFASMNMKTNFRRLEVMKEIIFFFDNLLISFGRYIKGQINDESSFASLFRRFAEVFFVDFMCPSPKAIMNIFGKTVSSIPDLRYELAKGGCQAVITVSEVKQTIVQSDDFSSDELCSGSHGYGEKKIEDILLPFNLQGQHAVDLLLQLPLSATEPSNGYQVSLGIIIQCTRVRLTCLRMSEAHRNLLHEEQPQDLGDLRAEIHYTRGYDILKKEDRKHIGYILLVLSYLADESVFKNF